MSMMGQQHHQPEEEQIYSSDKQFTFIRFRTFILVPISSTAYTPPPPPPDHSNHRIRCLPCSHNQTTSRVRCFWLVWLNLLTYSMRIQSVSQSERSRSFNYPNPPTQPQLPLSSAQDVYTANRQFVKNKTPLYSGCVQGRTGAGE